MPIKQRRTRAELKEMMLEAGGEVLVGLVPDIGFERLTYGAVFEHLQESRGEKVTIGSVHERIWASQRDFQLDVLRAIANDLPEDQFEGSVVDVVRMGDEVDLSTLPKRRHALQSAIRVGQNRAWHRAAHMGMVEQIAVSLRLRLWPLSDEHEEAEGFREVLRRNRRANAKLYFDLASSWVTAVGVRPKPDVGSHEEALESIITAMSAVNTGYVSDVLDEARQPKLRATGLDGELEEWYPLAWTSWLLVRASYEFADEGLSPAERAL